jgi:RHS repeat-associated protein
LTNRFRAGGCAGTNYPFLTQKERDIETGLDYFLARYYSSTAGRFTSTDPIFISDQQTYNPQLWNLYNYVGNNPLNATDPTGMELIQLGQNSDEEIDKRRKAIDQEKKAIRKDSSLTKAQQDEKRGKLEAEKNTLGLEKQGNQAARAYIARLESIGEGQGLQVSDFTLSTDPKNDFLSDPTFVSGAGGLEAAKQKSADVASGFMFHFVGYKPNIYINTTSSNYQLLTSGDADMVTYSGTAAVHERSHRDSPTLQQRLSEGRAYTEQLRVLQKFGPAAFKSRDFYDQTVDFVTRGSRRKD